MIFNNINYLFISNNYLKHIDYAINFNIGGVFLYWSPCKYTKINNIIAVCNLYKNKNKKIFFLYIENNIPNYLDWFYSKIGNNISNINKLYEFETSLITIIIHIFDNLIIDNNLINFIIILADISNKYKNFTILILLEDYDKLKKILSSKNKNIHNIITYADGVYDIWNSNDIELLLSNYKLNIYDKKYLQKLGEIAGTPKIIIDTFNHNIYNPLYIKQAFIYNKKWKNIYKYKK